MERHDISRMGYQTSATDHLLIETMRRARAWLFRTELLRAAHWRLEETNDWDWVSAQVNQVLARGNGAQRQRSVFAKTGCWEDVVDFIVTETEQETF